MSDTRQKMIQATAELLQVQGYHATGLSQIIQLSDTPKGSLYYHFPDGKQELAAAAVQQAGEAIQLLITHAAQSAETSAVAVEIVITALSAALERSDFQKGCPVATLALETAATNDYLQQTCRDIYRAWQQPLVERLQQEGWSAAESQQLAQFVFAAIEGALLLSRTERSTKPMETTMQLLKRMVRR